MRPEFFLEITSGSGIVPELTMMILLMTYLSKEARDRNLHFLDWPSLPPQMDLVIALLIFDSGILINSCMVWVWRRFLNAASFNITQSIFLGLGRTLILFGSICVVRALTKPDYGDRPWIITWFITIMAAILLIFIR